MIGRVVEIATEDCHPARECGLLRQAVANIVSFDGHRRRPRNENPAQFTLF